MAPPEEEFRDQQRRILLSELEQLIGPTVPPTTWAFLWLADIEKLEAWVKMGREEPIAHLTRTLLLNFDSTNKVLAKWMQTDRKDSFAPTSVPATPKQVSPRVSAASSRASSLNSDSRKRKLDAVGTNEILKNRSTTATINCETRDQSRCIITRDFAHDSAYIYPFGLRGHHLGDSPLGINIWTALKFFWSDDRVEAWYKAVFPQGKYVDVCYNQLCLSPTAHRYWGKGYFALKPISLSDDRKGLTVQFFWLRKGSHPSFVNFCQPPVLESKDQGHDYARLWNHETLKPIESGHEIHLTTTDPKNLPLPSWEILEMQWHLNRVLAISGAADVEDSDDDYDDDFFFLEQEQDLDMLHTLDSEDEQPSLPTDRQSRSSPSSLSPSSSGLQKRTIRSQSVTILGAATDSAADAVNTGSSD